MQVCYSSVIAQLDFIDTVKTQMHWNKCWQCVRDYYYYVTREKCTVRASAIMYLHHRQNVLVAHASYGQNHEN